MKDYTDKNEAETVAEAEQNDSIDLSVKPTVTDPKLQKIVDDIYRAQGLKNVIGNGTLMDAVRRERKAAAHSNLLPSAQQICSSLVERDTDETFQDDEQCEIECLRDEMCYKEVNTKLVAEFPAFLLSLDEWDLECLELQYTIASRFVDYLKAAHESGDRETYKKGLRFIEKMHFSECHNTCELATVGYLEAFLDWDNSDVLLEDLGEESKIWWLELNRFWSGEVEYIGQSFEQ